VHILNVDDFHPGKDITIDCKGKGIQCIQKMIIGYSTRYAATLHLRTQRGRIFFHGEKITSIAYKAGDAAGGIILLSAHA